MEITHFNDLIAGLGKALLRGDTSFENIAKEASRYLTIEDLHYLVSRLHYPPPLHTDVDKSELRHGNWLYICQYAIFELLYQSDLQALFLLKPIAFGEYDWPQINALEVICRLYADGKITEDLIAEIDNQLDTMKYETQLYFAHALLTRKNRDQRFDSITRKFKNISFQAAIAKLSVTAYLTRDELIALGKKIVAAEGTEEEIQQLMDIFDRNVPYPNGSSLFYYPENFNNSVDEESEYNPSVEEVVDKCLGSSRPFTLYPFHTLTH